MDSPLRRWTPALLWIAVIYTAIPFVRELREWFVARWDPRVIGWSVAAAVIAAAAVAGAALLRRRDAVRPGALPWLIGVGAALALWSLSLRRSPEESVHVIEYGVLALLLHRALRPAVPGAALFVVGALLGAMIGTIDEVIQWLTPSRYWDWRDLGINAGAGALVQLALWRATRRPESGAPRRSWRLPLRLAAVQLLLLTACLSNTPARVARYAPLLPSPAHLTSSRNPIAEYGRLHTAPGLGTFKSRLTLDELAAEDRARAAEVAAVLDGTRGRYGAFIDSWPVWRDPFTYEARVHLFARDRNLGRARRAGFEGAAARQQLAVAWSENRLLETFFGRTLAASSYRWGPRQRERIDRLRDPGAPFRSAVGSHLITAAPEEVIRAALLAAVAVLVIADLRLGRARVEEP